MNFCSICEEKFTSWVEYASHKLEAKCFKKILPVRTSKRSFVQIVHDMETIGPLKGKVIYPTTKVITTDKKETK